MNLEPIIFDAIAEKNAVITGGVVVQMIISYCLNIDFKITTAPIKKALNILGNPE